MMETWLLARFHYTSPFSLRSSATTSSGGKTNLVPTMYGVKIALVVAAFKRGHSGEACFELVKPLTIRFKPPRWAVVNHSRIRVWKPPHEGKAGPDLIPTVGYREFVYFYGHLTVALEVTGLPRKQIQHLEDWLRCVNYFGKRGSFVQPLSFELIARLGRGYTFVWGEASPEVNANIIIQYLDDVGPAATFAMVNTFSRWEARLGKERLLLPVALPYQRVHSGQRYTLYARVDEG